MNRIDSVWTWLIVAALPVALTSASAQSPAPTNVVITNDPGLGVKEAPRGHSLAIRIATMLEVDYLDPEIGARYAAMLRKNARDGAYDALSGVALANAITRDLAGVRDDNHLRVRFTAPSPASEPQQGSKAGASKRPPAIEQAGWIAPRIAFIRFNEFPDDAAVTEATRQFMQTHAKAKTIIFDLRRNAGGGIEQMDVIFPLLFDKPTRLVTMEARKSRVLEPIPASLHPGNSTPGLKRFDHVVTPAAKSRLTKARIFVLTARRTGSAGEHFAAAMKWSARATLIGAPTAGANHFGSIRSAGDGFTIFIPEGRTVHPETGLDWEGSGVAPDIAVAPQEALTVALVQSGVTKAEAARLSAAYMPQGSMEKPPLLMSP